MRSISRVIIAVLSVGAALLWALCVLVRGLVTACSRFAEHICSFWQSRRLPIGREYRAIRRVGSRLIAVRLQLVIA